MSMSDPHPPWAAVREAVTRALAEDLLPLGDLSASLVAVGAGATAEVVCRGTGVLAGRRCAEEAFAQMDGSLVLHWAFDDGCAVGPGDVLCSVEGPLRSILTAERTALNFLCQLSGVATLTRAFVEAAGAASATTRILDTRKTTPGLRCLEKAAVRAGGGLNHRGSLSEGVMLKDNHLRGCSIASLVSEAFRRWPGRLVEVECESPEQVSEAARAGATVVMCDNVSPAEVSACVALLAGVSPRPLLEVSGRVSLDNVAAYAAAGADLISVGAITHSAAALDIGLDMVVDIGGLDMVE
ncbi:MAG: carboxylating nicotinate-nucleotide diphosphorylase [Acidimicrobiales bacterium]